MLNREHLITTNYALFGRIVQNRTVSIKTKGRLPLIEAIIKFGLVNPIICVQISQKDKDRTGLKIEEYAIIDGQHRFAICKSLDLPIDCFIYSMKDGSDVPDSIISELVIITNNTGNPWSTKTFLKWIDEFDKNPYIKIFRKYLDTYKFLDMNGLYCILTGDIKQQAKVMIQSGKLKFDNPEEMQTLIANVDKCTGAIIQIRKDNQMRGYRKNVINLALYKVFSEKLISYEDMFELAADPTNRNLIETGSIIVCLESLKELIEDTKIDLSEEVPA
ncbi:MAG: ParB N-terminal domain-containing protein [Candidatus Saccharimonadaceae bacterium]